MFLIDNMPALVQIMAWRRPGGKPLSEPMMVWFTNANMHHLASVSWMSEVAWYEIISNGNFVISHLVNMSYLPMKLH